MPRRKRRLRRLSNLDVVEVSWVDKPANQIPFLFFKNEEGLPMEPEEEVIEDIDKQFRGFNFSFITDGTVDGTKVTLNRRKLENLMDLNLSYYPIYSTDVDAGPTPLGLRFGYTVKAKGETRDGFTATKTYRLSKGEDIDKAVWSTAFINDLPDAAFLYVEPGGKKDKTGKTTPKSLRHFPYKDATGKVDLPHLRNAIARIPQAKIPANKKKSLQAKARSLLAGQKKGIKKADEEDIAILKQLCPGIHEDIDGNLAKALADEADTIAIYKDDLPAALRDSIMSIMKVATETEIEEDEMSEEEAVEKDPKVEEETEAKTIPEPTLDTAKIVEAMKPAIEEAITSVLDARDAKAVEDAKEDEPPAEEEELEDVDEGELMQEALDEAVAEAAAGSA